MTRPPRTIDHLVLAVHDLEDAADFYTRMGFQVGARNRHPWGTENRLIQFRSSFLELITVAHAGQVPPHAPGVFSFGAFVEDYLTKREGLAMLAVDSSDAAADAAQFTREGIAGFQPFSSNGPGASPTGPRHAWPSPWPSRATTGSPAPPSSYASSTIPKRSGIRCFSTTRTARA